MAGFLSLPALKSVSDCADYALTIKPYIPQLRALPSNLLATASVNGGFTSKLQAIANVYTVTNPLVLAFAFSLALGPIVLFASEINRNYSQVDRLWSILPFVYVLHYDFWAHQNGFDSPKLDTAALCTGIWSARLTFNYWRKGGYSIGSEDYRWKIIKEKIGGIGMFLLNVSFISFGQSILLFIVTSPAYILLLVSRTQPALSVSDFLFAGVMLGLVGIEVVADQQQWNYQTTKHAYLKTAKIPAGSKFSQADLDRGFLVAGLWSWSRHPNFAAEQAVWLALYQWASIASHSLVNWSIAGAIGYLMLFQGSTWLTELLTAGKYPEYKEYQQLVGMFLPSVLGGAWNGKSVKEE